jgi:hypothetical protein
VARQAALERGARAGAAATGLAVALVLLAILEMPLSAWVISDIHGQTLAVGSAIASQDGSVRAVMHTLAAAASVLGAWLLARMLRPEWFGRRPPAAVRAPAAPQPARLMTEALRE